MTQPCRLRRAVTNRHRHAIDATPARWRGDAGSSPIDQARAAASSPRNDLGKNCRVHPTHWLIFTQVTVLDCLKGLHKARACNFFDFDTFDLNEYEHFEAVEHGDLNWLVYGRFFAFAGPHDAHRNPHTGYETLAPEDYVPYFKSRNISLIVRLNKPYYDRQKFLKNGIDHVDMYYLDGSNPPIKILRKFLEVCEQTTGAIGVHCKAGLGRTGTCIGCYCMKHHKFTAAEIIAWFRICRPGSVIGPQQHFMQEMERVLWQEGEAFKLKRSPSVSKKVVSKEDESVASLGSSMKGLALAGARSLSPSGTTPTQGDFLRQARQRTG